jgi:kinetochor protein Mis14/NSL1
MAESDNLHNKLQLVSEDVKFLKSQFHESAETKLDLHLPTEDSLKTRVRELVDEFIHETFELARHSIVVNGVDMSTQDTLVDSLQKEEVVEPFDVELNEKLRNLYAEVDERTLEVTELRRQIPNQASEIYKQKLKQEQDLLDQALPNEDQSTVNDEPISLPINRIQTDYEDTLQLIKSLSKSVPELYSDLNELQEVIDFLRQHS